MADLKGSRALAESTREPTDRPWVTRRLDLRQGRPDCALGARPLLIVQERLPLGSFIPVAPCGDESRDDAGANRSPEPLINGLVLTLEGFTLVR